MNVKQLCLFFVPVAKKTMSSIWRRFLDRLKVSTMKIDRQLFSLLIVLIIGYNFALIHLAALLWAWLASKDRLYFWKAKERISPPACLVSSSLGRHCYVQLQDVRLHYVEAGDRRKPMLLCLHGFAEIWYTWKHQLRTFSKTHWVIAVDMRGYGDSDKPRRTDQYDLRILIEDIRQLISKLGKETCVMMGHGLGAGIGWMFAAIHPNMVTHYIALSCLHPATLKHHFVNVRKRPFILRDMFFFQSRWIPELILQSQDNLIVEKIAKIGCSTEKESYQEVEAYKYYFGKSGAWRGPLNYYRQLFCPGSLIWMTNCQLRVRLPTLLLFGKKEANFVQSMVSNCLENVDRLDFHIIESASHWIQKEAPEEVNSVLAKFLNVSL